MKRTLGGWLALAAVATVAASCSGASSPTLDTGGDSGSSGSSSGSASSSGSGSGSGGDSGSGMDGTMPTCGSAGAACCNGTACNQGLTCTGGKCVGSDGGGQDSGSGSGGMDSSLSDTGSGSDTGTSGDTGTVTDSGSHDATSDASEGGTVVPCPTGLQCNVKCVADGGTTSISGVVYDPAGKNPLYNVAVYVPATPLVPLPRGVPTGADACSCPALYPSGAITTTTTLADGSFVLTNAPVGSAVPLVIQIGKWRRQITIPVTACVSNPQPDKSLTLPSTVAAGDVIDNMPDIAVSTGGADTLECLMHRIGLPTTEYVAGTGTTGHVHVFSGGDPAGGLGNWGLPESPAMAGAPVSYTNLWDSQAHLMPYDIVLLSCEGGETYSANPPVLEQYLNAGGRVFASHYHYAWFAGPLQSGQAYTAPLDWGSNLATWAPDTLLSATEIGGLIDTTLNGSGKPFPKGVALETWLGLVNALGKNGEPAGELSIYTPRFDATVGATNTPSQAWITADSASGHAGSSMYFSFNTPVNAPAPPDGGTPNYCGRAVFSDLHVDGDPSTLDTPPPPAGCSSADLSPQEKALEFMIFDLSSCVVPDTIAPGLGIPRR